MFSRLDVGFGSVAQCHPSPSICSIAPPEHAGLPCQHALWPEMGKGEEEKEEAMRNIWCLHAMLFNISGSAMGETLVPVNTPNF